MMQIQNIDASDSDWGVGKIIDPLWFWYVYDLCSNNKRLEELLAF
jgi:hypothetical protein